MKSHAYIGLCAKSSVSVLALFIGTSAAAQAVEPLAEAAAEVGRDEANASSGEQAVGETIVVTGSRIVRNGADQPTPVTVLTIEELTSSAASIPQAMAQIPQLARSTTVSNPQNMGGLNFLDLRGLGSNRTLVLLDGRRLTPATTGTSPDINSLPQSLIRHVDVVTGGASAAYGSDAVAGVVNFVLDTKFTGIKGNVQAGITDRGDNQNYTISLAAGTPFAGGKGHLVASFEYQDSAGALTSKGRGWANRGFLPLPNPGVTASNPASPSNPNIVIVPNAGYNRSVGGTILTGPLRGIDFGSGGTVGTFPFGPFNSAQYMQGDNAVKTNFYSPLHAQFWRWAAFAHGTYELSDNVTAFAEVNISKNSANSRVTPTLYDLPIFSGNAFLPTSVQDQMTARGLSSITVSKIVLDWQKKPGNELYDAFSVILDDVTAEDFSGGLNGKYTIGERPFTWSASYQHGKTTYQRRVPNNPINANVFSAIDAVRVTAENQGASGLPIGSIACRISLTRSNTGCIPFDIFGPNTGQVEALQYMYGPDSAGFKQSTTQDSAALSTQGELFSTGAGPVSVAIGAEWRKVRTEVTSHPLNQIVPADYVAANTPGVRGLPGTYLSANPGVFLFGNYQPLSGSYNVKEFFGETVVPLAAGSPFANKLELNGAVRYADYSTSGGVWTWKGGVVYEPFEGLRFRGTRSRDVRAPNILELFSAARQLPRAIRDPLTGDAYQVATFPRGNRDLAPEKADTLTLGVVYQPSWLPRFTASIDFFDIKIQDAIAALSGQQIIDECQNGNALLCSFIGRDPETNRILEIQIPNTNIATLREKGLDLEFGYAMDVGTGELSFRALGTYIHELSTASISNAPAIDRAGDVGSENGGLPHWSGRLNIKYSNGPFSINVQERYVGPGKFDNTYNTDRYNAPGVPITYINDNRIKARAYTDLTLRYQFQAGGAEVEAFGIVTNVLDQAPPIVPILRGVMTQTNFFLYDVLGRTYTAGMKFKF